ncbi:hypothetical protein FHL15_007807 [Xylaria flabelliformis]|uniref:Fungal-type protein kinase domain-containing protein n=1 Tax=Xylaria flabelliformis TaxID=2512241 RepID=A0A553HTU8_9PEZI|nr:hypothetical protein FHL15_007807 [Xylaria flabelliformis]
MMMLSDNLINIIANHPLQLDQARDPLLNCYDALLPKRLCHTFYSSVVRGTYDFEQVFRLLIDVVLRNSPDLKTDVLIAGLLKETHWKKEFKENILQLAPQECSILSNSQMVYATITTIKELREGLTFPKPYRFNDKASNMRDLHVDLSSVNASGRKRKSLNNGSDNAPSCKRRRSTCGASTNIPNDQAKLSLEMIDENQSSEQMSLPDGTVEKWENKVYYCVVVPPAGRFIRDFKSIKELLGSMRDAVEAHQSLF